MVTQAVTGRGEGNGRGCPDGDGNRRLQKSLATAHAKGLAAYEAGVARESCPYEGGMTQKYRIHWLSGWDEGKNGIDYVLDLENVAQRPEFYGLVRGDTYGAVRGLGRVR
jgi:ribosome modulation factor